MKYTEDEILGLVKTMTLDERRYLIEMLYKLEFVPNGKFLGMAGIDLQELRTRGSHALDDAICEYCKNKLDEDVIVDRLG